MVSPVYGSGIIPAQNSAVMQELSAVTRRAFIPEVVVQIYKSSPFLAMALRNAQRAAGGLSQVTQPIQNASFVNYSWSDYSGTFQLPSVQTALQSASWNLSLGTIPVSLLGMESIVQSTEAVIPIVRARMGDMMTVAKQTIANALFTSNATNALQTNGLIDVYDDGTTVNTYGGISRTATPQWKSNVYSTSITPSRSTMITRLVQNTTLAGGEAPDFGIMSMQDWTTLMQDYMQAETFRTMPGSRYGDDDPINAGFRCVMLGNTPFLGDPFCPVGTAYTINSKYLSLYISEDGNFSLTDWHSLISNGQLASIAVMIVLMALVCSKPSSGMKLSNVTGAAF